MKPREELSQEIEALEEQLKTKKQQLKEMKNIKFPQYLTVNTSITDPEDFDLDVFSTRCNFDEIATDTFVQQLYDYELTLVFEVQKDGSIELSAVNGVDLFDGGSK